MQEVIAEVIPEYNRRLCASMRHDLHVFFAPPHLRVRIPHQTKPYTPHPEAPCVP